MPRPSLNADLAMLTSGRALYAQHGCAGLSVRAVAEHAGVNPGLFHYHFGSKDGFLRAVLQSLYEEMFEPLSGAAQLPGPPVDRLRGVLILLGRFLRDHAPEVGRIWSDASQGEPVAVAFVQANAPRHIALITGLLAEAELAGSLEIMPPLQRMAFLIGSVAAPILVAGRLTAIVPDGVVSKQRLMDEVMADDAIAARIDMALGALVRQEGQST